MTCFPSFLNDSVDEAAKQLLGCFLESEIGGDKVKVRIVETESYDQDDEASHAYGGMRKRNAVMFSKPGSLYVYFTYGMHYCCNVVTGPEGYGSAVLIRAVEPIIGTKIIEERRGRSGSLATNGPAKLCQALGIDLDMNGHDLRLSPVRLIIGNLREGESIATSPRIGISKAKDDHRRFYIKDNGYVSC